MDSTDQNPGLAAFTAALPTLRGDLHRYLARMLGSVIDAEDLLQDTLLAATTALQNGAQVRDLRAWLFRIAHNTAMNTFRARSREASMKQQITAMPDPVVHGRAATLPEALTPYLALTPNQRSIVILRDVLGYSTAEVAALIDLSPSAVKSALNRGRQSLDAARADADLATPAPRLSKSQSALLTRYAALFNAHDFDGLRAMLSAEVRLDLVARETRTGKQRVSGYFTNYSKLLDWHMVPGVVETSPAILCFDPQALTAPPIYFILLDADTSGVLTIRDFRYARYVMADARWAPLTPQGGAAAVPDGSAGAIR